MHPDYARGCYALNRRPAVAETRRQEHAAGVPPAEPEARIPAMEAELDDDVAARPDRQFPSGPVDLDHHHLRQPAKLSRGRRATPVSATRAPSTETPVIAARAGR